ncbi:type I polyketide synthase [Streptomyces sp. NPDC060184]|uniref:type I polyketide synthase n=1 Tax=Streptomyces sp. NPDC060184 TaxID=3347064 RepID=UPI0036650632
MPRESGSAGSAIAVIGMGCRFPQAGGVDEFWNNLLANTDAITPVGSDRFDAGLFHHPTPGTPGKTVSRHGGFLDAPFAFDASFFGIAPVEAKAMDPQQRLLLHVVWEALEDAGIVPSSLAASRTGVFVGQATAEYGEVHAPPGVHGAVGSRIRGATAGRISYAMDLRGPSLVLDTACSSSLVAVHGARQSLLSGESDLAIAGAVNFIVSPDDAIAYSQGGMLSPGGRCRFGDARADGFVRSEGVGAVILKRLDDALADGDPVLGVILGSAVTHEGQGDGLLLRPSVGGQRAMLREACRAAGVGVGQLDYVEAHGTGTTIGDAVELEALIAERREDGPRTAPLRVGSVKSNIGHAEAAAGMAGLIKSLLILRHRTVPATLHVSRPNDQVAAAADAVRLVTRNEPLAPQGGAALIGVSSFGISGTNAHVVLGAHAPVPRDGADAPRDGAAPAPHLLVLSARSPRALNQLALSYAAFLRPGGAGHDLALGPVCAAAATRREGHAHRLWAVGATHAELADQLDRLARGENTANAGTGDAGPGPAKRTVFVFPGQGSQWVGMGQELLASSPAFRRTLTACDRVLGDELGWSVLELLGTRPESFPTAVEVVQPALWAMEIALAAAWAERGVTPDVCVGHSMGETAAAHIAGALSLADAAAVIARRSRLMKRLAGRGSMMAVELGGREAAEVVSPYGGLVCVAAKNAPTATVLSGDGGVLDEIAEKLDARGVMARKVNVNVASHSPLTDELRADLLQELAGLSPGPVSRTMVSTVTGEPVEGPELHADYWVRNLRGMVRFTDAIRAAGTARDSVFVEVSPHPLLTHGTEETLGRPGCAVESLRRDQDPASALARSVGRFYAAGGRVDWERYHGGRPEAVALPRYPWQATAFRLDPAPDAASGTQHGHTRHLDLAEWAKPAGWGDAVGVDGFAPVPPVVHAGALLHVARELRPGTPLSLRQVRLHGASVEAADADALRLKVSLRPDASGWQGSVLAEHPRFAEPVPCMTATIRVGGEIRRESGGALLDRALASCGEYLPEHEFARYIGRMGFAVSPPFQAVERAWRRNGAALGRMRRPEASAPAAWESALLPLLAALAPTRFGVRQTYAPVGFGSIEFAADLPERFWSVARVTASSGSVVRGDVVVLGDDGRIVARFGSIVLRRSAGDGQAAAKRLSALVAHARGRLLSPATAVRRSGADPAPPAPERAPVRPAADADGSAPTHPTHPAPPTHPQGLPALAASVLGMDGQDLDLDRSLHAQGLDSLMAVRLRHQMSALHDVRVSTGRLLGEESVRSLASDLARAVS